VIQELTVLFYECITTPLGIKEILLNI
jgi:hypothetical protein